MEVSYFNFIKYIQVNRLLSSTTIKKYLNLDKEVVDNGPQMFIWTKSKLLIDTLKLRRKSNLFLFGIKASITR